MLKKVVNLIPILIILANTTCTSEDTWNWEDDFNIDNIQKDKWILPQNPTVRGHRDSIKKIRYSPDGKMLAVARGYGITLYNVETRKELFVFSDHTHWVQFISFSPAGDTLASASWDKTIRLWDTHTGTLKYTLTQPKDWTWSVSFSPAGDTLASASWGTIYIWNTNTGELNKTFTNPDKWGEIKSISFSPDGHTLASSSEDKYIDLWNANTGELNITLLPTNPFGEINFITFSPDGHILVSASERTVQLWNVNTGKLEKILTGHKNWVEDISFSPNGNTFASAGRDGDVRLWDTHTGTLKYTLTSYRENQHGKFPDPKWSVSFSPDGKTLASGSDFGTIYFWRNREEF